MNVSESEGRPVEAPVPATTANHLYEFALRLTPLDGSDMPGHWVGADVVCYSAAADHLSAIRNGVAAAREQHFDFDDLRSEPREIPVSRWDEYLEHVWPEYREHLPSPARIAGIVDVGGVFFGPFAGFEAGYAKTSS